MRTLNIETPTHGRVLVQDAVDAAAVIVGFHGYMEDAGTQMRRLADIAGAERWTLVSVQGLHRFYRGRSEDVVASWMTRQDRELMIADNIEYASRVLEALSPEGRPVIAVGFSQGVAMAFRLAVRGRVRVKGVAGVGGDVPPDLLADPSAPFPAVLLAGGERDEWYTPAKRQKDVTALSQRGVPVSDCGYAGAHEWTAEVSRALSAFIRDVSRR
jgi:predicted esterase